ALVGGQVDPADEEAVEARRVRDHVILVGDRREAAVIADRYAAREDRRNVRGAGDQRVVRADDDRRDGIRPRDELYAGACVAAVIRGGPGALDELGAGFLDHDIRVVDREEASFVAGRTVVRRRGKAGIIRIRAVEAIDRDVGRAGDIRRGGIHDLDDLVAGAAVAAGIRGDPGPGDRVLLRAFAFGDGVDEIDAGFAVTIVRGRGCARDIRAAAFIALDGHIDRAGDRR